MSDRIKRMINLAKAIGEENSKDKSRNQLNKK